MALFNLVTPHVRDGRPVGFNFDVPGIETLDDLFQALLRDGLIRCDRLTFSDSSGTRVVRDRVPIVLGKGMVGQISLATSVRTTAPNLHGRRTLTTRLPEKTSLQHSAR